MHEPGTRRCLLKYPESSLVRHLKNNCNQSNRQSTRRRSCRQCASKKAKCNLKQPTCSRCSLRNIDCDYPKEQSTPASIDQTQLTGKRATDILQFDNLDKDTETTEQTLEAHPTLETEENLFDSLFSNPSAWPTPQLSSFTSFLSNTPNTLESLQMSNGGILTPDTELIGGPPLSFSAPDSTGGIIPYALAKHSMELIFRILRTWPEMLADEFQTPPLFHVTQIIPGKKLPYPLATCITLTKMWHGTCEGAEELVRKTILQELGNLVDKVSYFKLCMKI